MKKKILILSLLLAISFLFLPPKSKVYSLDLDIVSEHNLDYNYDLTEVTNFYYYNELRNELINNPLLNIAATLAGKKIMIETSEDLYNWSKDLSFFGGFSKTIKDNLVNKDYILGQDIDYSEQKAKRFVPIGYSYLTEELVFTGSFDGRGFEIKNLYFSVFSEYYFVDDEDQIKVPSAYFSMFSFNNGNIKNLGLINPIIDLENEHPDLRNFAYLVGENRSLGVVENVYVEDLRDTGGLRASASQVTEENVKLAAGIVHTNRGTFKNSYFAGPRVVNSAFQSFFRSEPLVYNNLGSSEKLVYDSNIYLGNANNGSGETNLKTTSALTIFRYYPLDGYPKLFGLTKNGDNYEINGALDLIYFTKLINLRTTIGNKPFNEESYVLTENINFRDVSTGAYKTPVAEFTGSFVGLEKTVNGNTVYPQINNLVIDTAVIDGENIYYGLFSIFGGHFENIVFYNATITPKAEQVEDYTNSNFYIGFVAGILDDAEVKNVYIKGEIDLDETNVGAYRVGSVAGEASGHIERVIFDTSSFIDGGAQAYGSKSVKDNYYIGGIIGKTSESKKLTLYNALNKGALTGPSGSRQASNDVSAHVGGVIGSSINTQVVRHNIGFITNLGSITGNQMTITGGNKQFINYIGGVIGLSTGNIYDFSAIYGKWTNKGNIGISDVTNGYVAGVLNSDHSSDIEFVKLYNEINMAGKATIEVSTLINHLSNQNITVSQAISKGNYTLANKSAGIAVYVANSSVSMQLNYVEIENNISYSDSISNMFNVAGVTLHERTNFLNVIYNGNININVTSGSNEIWVSGLTKVLSSGYYIKNGVNEGNMNVESNSTGNLFVAGLVNRNLSGDLHDQDTAARPRATIGVLNSLNLSDIEVLAKNTGNTFVGGLVTLNGGENGGSVQDAVNVGNILVRNNSASATASFSGDDTTGGLVTYFAGGIIIGGVTSTIANGRARIFDTSNKGDVIGIASHFVRSGGVLGSALLFEIQSDKSGLSTSYYYTGNALGNAQYISNAIVSNGINYGDVQAVTQNIASYPTATSENNDNGPSAQRPGIYSSAGGVIGYGLTHMKRMINHGNISATDVAGGVVGATMAYSTTSSSAVIPVVINTAINYGSIRAIKTSNYTSVYNAKKATEAHFYAVNDPWIYPTPPGHTAQDLKNRPMQKRGFGGVFGRLQRARNQKMSANGTISTIKTSFDFVVNMDPNVDLIGRLDQVYNYSSSLNYFVFIDAKYYSAKPNDNTQTVFTGEFRSTNTYTYNYVAASGYSQYSRRSSGGRYYRTLTYRFNSAAELYVTMTGTLQQGQLTKTNHLYIDDITTFPYTVTFAEETINQTTYNNTNTNQQNFNNQSGSISGSINQTIPKPTPRITESAGSANNVIKYVYDIDFEMRKSTTTLDNGEPITSHIYFAENALLANGFSTTRPNGMYVLASSSGSNYGAVLPKNFNLLALRRLKADVPNNLNYNNVSDTHLLGDEDSYFADLMTHYESLYQTILSDKSALLDTDQRVKVKDKNSGAELFFQSASFTGNTLQLSISRDVLGVNPTFTLNLEILEALLPEGAIIAKSGATQAELINFVNNNPGVKIATGSLAPNLSRAFSSWPGINTYTQIGTFTAYSEAAIHDANFTSFYQTQYSLEVRFTNNTYAAPTFYQRSIDGGAYNATNSSLASPYVINNDIGLRFRENQANAANHKLPNGYVVDEFLELYYTEGGQNVLVNKAYYEINSVPKAARDFDTVVNFGSELRAGRYEIRYKFYNSDTTKIAYINYQPSRVLDFLEFKPYTSTAYDGSIADIRFNYDLFTTHGSGVNRTIINAGYPYLADYYEYEIDFLENFKLSEFLEFDNVQITSNIVSGYKVYTLNFREGGTTVITKTIRERNLTPVYYKDNTTLTTEDLQGEQIKKAVTTAKREADTTIFTLDYKLGEDFYNAEDFIITYNYEGGAEIDITEDIADLYFFIDGRLNIVMTKNAIPGDYEITIYYKRDELTNLLAGKIEVEKETGTSGYLTDIKFSKYVMGAEYPSIYVTNNNNTVIDESYDLNVYYQGIDYDNADRHFKEYFRIDGEVARIPLNYYMPVDIIDFLPPGAKIQRKYYENGVPYWSDLVGEEDDEEIISASLSTDFTIDPATGAYTGERVYIEYRVIPESEIGQPNPNSVTYFISVVDVDYTFLAVISIHYKDEYGQYHIIDEVLKFDETLLFLNVFNYDVAKDGIELTDEDVVNVNNFNTIEFDEILGIDSKVSMFYYVDQNIKDEYYYQLGSNLSGFYRFELNLPKDYIYKMYFNSYDDEDNLLPLFSEYLEGMPGYFYYINTSSVTRTQYFHIVIEDGISSDQGWGFTDNQTTWS